MLECSLWPKAGHILGRESKLGHGSSAFSISSLLELPLAHILAATTNREYRPAVSTGQDQLLTGILPSAALCCKAFCNDANSSVVAVLSGSQGFQEYSSYHDRDRRSSEHISCAGTIALCNTHTLLQHTPKRLPNQSWPDPKGLCTASK